MATTILTGLTLKGGHVLAQRTTEVDFTAFASSSSGLSPLSPAPTGSYTNASVTVNAFGQVTAAASGSAAATPILEQVWEALDANTDPVDTIITSGSYRVFVFASSWNANSWHAASSAYTVPASKKLLVVHRICSVSVPDSSRDARLWNVTDGAAVDTVSAGSNRVSGVLLWQGDGATASANPSVAAGKQLRAEIWNANTSKRANAVVYVCREVAA